jgi:hypothetical protein
MNSNLSFQESMMAGLKAAGAATLINAILFLAMKSAGIITDDIHVQPEQPLTIMPVMLGSIFPALIGSLVFFIMEKLSAKGFANFRILAIVLLIISFASPFMGIKGVTTGYALVLCLMHAAVAIPLLYFIGKAKGK